MYQLPIPATDYSWHLWNAYDSPAITWCFYVNYLIYALHQSCPLGPTISIFG